jgi:hypothetical protein
MKESLVELLLKETNEILSIMVASSKSAGKSLKQ